MWQYLHEKILQLQNDLKKVAYMPVPAPGNKDLVIVHSDEQQFNPPTNKGETVCTAAQPKKGLSMETANLQPELLR